MQIKNEVYRATHENYQIRKHANVKNVKHAKDINVITSKSKLRGYQDIFFVLFIFRFPIEETYREELNCVYNASGDKTNNLSVFKFPLKGRHNKPQKPQSVRLSEGRV